MTKVLLVLASLFATVYFGLEFLTTLDGQDLIITFVLGVVTIILAYGLVSDDTARRIENER